ncbi:centromere protein Scm3-domain-containing protein [Aspergillus coremiiformis]|uniref:Centromere protein Scm3-domain-containing protein n=1 Tax=Aspergillus coremiiformis TaxID=138285 RepID=A0A5N6Z1V1_9EURO|nr:centromere protein Scm3-domain-containing protein [Aspergillus coremiiformis]
MERPLKRPRLSFAKGPNDESDSIDLQTARAQNDQRLKSIFEGIFERYGKDFTDVGDEIDLQTGRIVVNNGHIQRMEDEGDTGERGAWLFDTETSAINNAATVHSISQYSETGTSDDLLEENNTYLQHPLAATQFQTRPGLDRFWERRESEAFRDIDDDRSSVDSLLDTALSVQNGPDDPVQRKNLTDTGAPVTEKANPAAETSVQSQGVQKGDFTDAVDLLWHVPEIIGKLSTPPLSRSRPTISPNVVRSVSPPGAGSLWALPGNSRCNTDGMKRSAQQHGTSECKQNHQSSPVVCDWSFAQTPDGSESDDPLQENHQLSPSPNGAQEIRGKRLGSYTPSRTKNQTDDCKEPYSRNDHISPSRQASLNSESQHDTKGSTKQSRVTVDIVALDTQLVANNKTKINGISEVTQNLKIKPVDNQRNPEDSTTPTKRAWTIMTPDEARLIVVLRQVQRKKWKEVMDRLPGKTVTQFIHWNRLHWSERRANPPPLSKPWSSTERETLNNLKDQQGLTWHAVRVSLPGRTLAEIEFELLRLWVGNDVWISE